MSPETSTHLVHLQMILYSAQKIISTTVPALGEYNDDVMLLLLVVFVDGSS